MRAVLIFFLCCSINLSFAATYYFSQTDGDDRRSSIQAQNPITPWQSTAKLRTSLNLKSGDSILFKRGDIWLDTTLEPPSDGLMFGSYGKGELPVIDGGRNVALNVSHLSRKRLVFEYIAFKRTGAVDIVAQFGNAWSGINSGMINSVVRNCDFYGGVIVQGSYNLIENNIIDGETNDGNGNGIWEHHQFCHHNTYKGNIVRNFSIRGIWTMIDTHHCLFEENVVSNCKMAGIDLDGADYVVYDHIVKGNIVYDILNDAIELENAFNCIITENRMHGGGRAYIYVINYEKCTIREGRGANNGIGASLNTTISNNVMIGGGADDNSMAIGVHRASAINIYNNTIFKFRSRFLDIDYELKSEVKGIRLVNNIFSTMETSSWYAMINFAGDDYDVLEEDDFNCFYNQGRSDIYTARKQGEHKSLDEYSILTGKAVSSISRLPGFISEQDLCLAKGSPCSGTGKVISGTFNRTKPNMGACQQVCSLRTFKIELQQEPGSE